MKIPAIQYSHKTGLSDTDCPVTITVEVSIDSRTNWVSTGANYSNLVSATSSGALTLIPSSATFGSGTDTAFTRRDIRVTYTNSVTSVAITDTFTVNVYSTAAIAKLANDQLDTTFLNPHQDVTYIVGGADLAVSSTSITVKAPVDVLGFNDFSTVTTPSLTYALQCLIGTTWTTITSANYLTTGIVGASSTPCIKSGSLGATVFDFTMSCTDTTKFGQDSTG